MILGVWTQGFMLARQALYRLSLGSSPFFSGYFGQPGPWSFYFMLSTHSWDDKCLPLHPAFFLIKMGSLNIFCPIWPGTSPPSVNFLQSLGWQACITMSSCWLRWGSHKVLPAWPQIVIFPSSASQVGRITGVSYWCPTDFFHFILFVPEFHLMKLHCMTLILLNIMRCVFHVTVICSFLLLISIPLCEPTTSCQ
jgi:hypothetical protein